MMKDTQLWRSPSQKHRNLIKKIWLIMMLAATCFSILTLFILLFSVIENSFGYVFFRYQGEIPPVLTTKPLSELSRQELQQSLRSELAPRILQNIERKKDLNKRSLNDLRFLFFTRVLDPSIEKTFGLFESLTQKRAIFEEAGSLPGIVVEFRSWISLRFLTSSQHSNPLQSGVWGAIVGSFWVIFITIIFTLPIGVGSAIFLSEYLSKNRLSKLLQVIVYNLAGIPSIIYGLLGLVVFVRVLEPLTSGRILGIATDSYANGRTIISAGLTLSLLVLPVVIINTQEALHAVPNTIRYSSYALGATRWQTTWYHLLPHSFARILTGSILAISRAVGETAPLVVVGASTFLTLIPQGIFSKFTALPIQIYQWASRPQQEFRHLSSAAIIVLLVLMILLNSTAIFLRQKIKKTFRSL